MIHTEGRQIFAENLRRFIQQKGLNQNEICDDLNISYSTFSDWCRGKAYPRIDKIDMLADYFGITRAELVERRDSSKSQYYYDSEVESIARELHQNPQARMLFMASRKLSAKDMATVKALVDHLIEGDE